MAGAPEGPEKVKESDAAAFSGRKNTAVATSGSHALVVR
jgi:hypothetical protein